jgi:hypothetical protein
MSGLSASLQQKGACTASFQAEGGRLRVPYVARRLVPGQSAVQKSYQTIQEINVVEHLYNTHVCWV